MKQNLLTNVAASIETYREAYRVSVADARALRLAVEKSQTLERERIEIREKVVGDPSLADDTKFKKQFSETIAEDEISKAAIEGLTAKSKASREKVLSLGEKPVSHLWRDLEAVIAENVRRHIQEIMDLASSWGPGYGNGNGAVQVWPLSVARLCRHCAAAERHKSSLSDFRNGESPGNAAILTDALEFLVSQAEMLWGESGEPPSPTPAGWVSEAPQTNSSPPVAA